MFWLSIFALSAFFFVLNVYTTTLRNGQRKGERKAESGLEFSEHAAPFSMRNSHECSKLLLEANLNQISTLMLNVINDGEINIRNRKSQISVLSRLISGSESLLDEADAHLQAIVRACHGPVSDDLLAQFTARNWVSDLYICSHHPFGHNPDMTIREHPAFRSGHPKHFTGEWCTASWRGYMVRG